MTPFGRDRGRLETDQTQALSHPVRMAILNLFTQNQERSLRTDDLLADLIEMDRSTFERFNSSQIAYHRARLQDAELIPTG
jgi:hypothetical protein